MLTQEQIQQLMAAGLGGGALTQGGNIYTPTWVPSGTTDANDGGYTFGGYNSIPQGWKFGDIAQQYDAQGNRTGEWATTAPDLWDKLGPGLAMSLIGYAGLQGLMGGMGFGDAGAGGLDVASGGSGGGGGGFLNGFEAGVPTAGEMAASNAAFAETLAPYLSQGASMGAMHTVPTELAPGAAAAGAGGDLVNGAFLGEGMASGIPAWDLAATNAGLSLATPAGAIMQNSPMSLIPESAMPGTVTGYAGPTFGGAAAASLIPGVSNSMLGAGLTAAGALAGKEGTPGQTSERKMDPRLDNYVFGQNGVVPMAAGLLSQQMPMAQQGGQQAFDFGRGLLGRGVAANPFMR